MPPISRNRVLGTACVVAALLAGWVLRTAWPLSDPPESLSWSSGVYTDGPGNVLPARDAVVFGDADRVPIAERDVYPLLNAVTRVAFEWGGARRRVTEWLAAALGLLAVVVVADAIRRSAGPRAALLAVVLGSTSWWLGSYSRILLAESVSTLLIAVAIGFAMSRAPAYAWLAGVVATAAGLIGKFHALAFLPAIGAFLVLRGGARVGAAFVAGVASAATAWWFAVFAPHRAEILEWIRESSVGVQETSTFARFPQVLGEPLRTLVDAWLLHQMPIVATVAAFATATTFAGRAALRRRVEDGSALFTFGLVTLLAYHTALPYRAPRYFVPIALLLVCAAACELGRRLARTAAEPSAPWTRFLALFVLAFTLLDAGRHLEAAIRIQFFAWDWARAGNHASDFAIFYDVMGTPLRHGALALLLATIFFVALHWRPIHLGRRSALFAITLVIVLNGAQWSWWSTHRTRTVEEAKAAFRGALGERASVLGSFAPMLALDSDIVAIPQFRRWDRVSSWPGATHLVVASAGEQAAVEERFPELARRLIPVQRLPVRAAWTHTLLLLRLPPDLIPSYVRSPFERVVDLLREEDWNGALEELRESGESVGVVDQRRVLEATCRFRLGDFDAAAVLLHDVARDHPADAVVHVNLATIALARGDTTSALAEIREGIRIDPMEPIIRESVRRWGEPRIDGERE